jgi:hypothetical protein
VAIVQASFLLCSGLAPAADFVVSSSLTQFDEVDGIALSSARSGRLI